MQVCDTLGYFNLKKMTRFFKTWFQGSLFLYSYMMCIYQIDVFSVNSFSDSMVPRRVYIQLVLKANLILCPTRNPYFNPCPNPNPNKFQ